jgi:hypothetical protein
MESEEPNIVLSMMDSVPPATLAPFPLPYTLRPLPTAAVLLRLKAEPRLTKLSVLIMDPILAEFLTLKDEPRHTCDITLNAAPMKALPHNESELPHRAAPLTLRVLPRAIELQTENTEPSCVLERRLNDEPI